MMKKQGEGRQAPFHIISILRHGFDVAPNSLPSFWCHHCCSFFFGTCSSRFARQPIHNTSINKRRHNASNTTSHSKKWYNSGANASTAVPSVPHIGRSAPLAAARAPHRRTPICVLCQQRAVPFSRQQRPMDWKKRKRTRRRMFD